MQSGLSLPARKVDAAKNYSRRIPFAPSFEILSSGAAFYLISQLHELCFALRRTFRSPALVQNIHGIGTDGARHISLAVSHGEHDDHAIVVVCQELSPRERHLRIRRVRGS